MPTPTSVRPCPGPGCDDGQGQPVLTSQPLCDDCTVRARRLLASVPVLWARLHARSLEPLPRAGAEMVSGSRETALPGGEAWSHAAELAAIVCGWEDAFRQWQGFHPVRRRNGVVDAPAAAGQRDIEGACRFLDQALEHLVDGPAGVEPLIEIRQAVGRAYGLLSGGKGDVRLPGTCPACEIDGALTWRNGGDYIECALERGGCGRPWEMPRLIRLAASSRPNLLLAAREIALLLGVSPGTVSKWATAGRITPAGCHVKTRRVLYRPDDVHEQLQTTRETSA